MREPSICKSPRLVWISPSTCSRFTVLMRPRRSMRHKNQGQFLRRERCPRAFFTCREEPLSPIVDSTAFAAFGSAFDDNVFLSTITARRRAGRIGGIAARRTDGGARPARRYRRQHLDYLDAEPAGRAPATAAIALAVSWSSFSLGTSEIALVMTLTRRPSSSSSSRTSTLGSHLTTLMIRSSTGAAMIDGARQGRHGELRQSPVKDRDKSMAFFKEIGVSFNPQFTDKTAWSCPTRRPRC
jgi:hypothetical protein